MRSFIVTAAIAATLVSTSLTAGYAASSATVGAPATRAEKAPATRAEKIARTSIVQREKVARSSAVPREPRTRVNEQADPVPPVMIYPQWSMSAPMAYPRMRLSLIESGLRKATRNIDVDRRHGELTRNQASFVREEESSVRAEAMNIAARHDGRIPNASYAMLQGRISNLDRAIHRYVINSANG